MSFQTTEVTKEESYHITTSWVREWLLLETSLSNTGAYLNCSLFDLGNVSLNLNQANVDANGPMASMSTSRVPTTQGTFLNNMGNNLSSFFNSFKIYAKALEVDLQLKRKYLNKHCHTISHFLNDQGITSELIDFPNDIIEENGYQLVKLLEFFGGGLNLSIIKQDNLFDNFADSMMDNKTFKHKNKSKQNNMNIIPDSKIFNKKVRTPSVLI